MGTHGTKTGFTILRLLRRSARRRSIDPGQLPQSVIVAWPAKINHVIEYNSHLCPLGTVFPLVESIKAAASTSTASEHDWLQYWILHGCLSVVSQDAGRFLERFGPGFVNHFYEFQFYSVLWLILPMTDGAAVVNELVTKKYITPLIEPTGDDALSHASDVQRRRRSLPQYPRADRGTARGTSPQGREEACEGHGQATSGVETRRGGGGDRRGLLGRGQDAKVGDDSDIID